MTGASFRQCRGCGARNFGRVDHCLKCGAALADAPVPPRPLPNPGTFCGHCGTLVEPGLKFCGECGAPAEGRPRAAAPSVPPPAPPASEWAPKPSGYAPPSACPGCGTPVTPGKRFCRKCGTEVASGQLPRQPARASAPTPPPQRAAAPPAAAPQASKTGPGMGRKLAGVLLPLGSMVATYYATTALGTGELAQRMNLPPQLMPMLISMAVGGVARVITK